MKEYIVLLDEEEAFYGYKDNARELIRCMDCKYWSAETEQTAVPNMHKCTWWRTIGTLPIDFCSWAERKYPKIKAKETE